MYCMDPSDIGQWLFRWCSSLREQPFLHFRATAVQFFPTHKEIIATKCDASLRRFKKKLSGRHLETLCRRAWKSAPGCPKSPARDEKLDSNVSKLSLVHK